MGFNHNLSFRFSCPFHQSQTIHGERIVEGGILKNITPSTILSPFHSFFSPLDRVGDCFLHGEWRSVPQSRSLRGLSDEAIAMGRSFVKFGRKTWEIFLFALHKVVAVVQLIWSETVPHIELIVAFLRSQQGLFCLEIIASLTLLKMALVCCEYDEFKQIAYLLALTSIALAIFATYYGSARAVLSMNHR